MVKVGVQTEDLAETSLDITQEAFREAGILANPVTASESRQRSVKIGRWHSDGGVGVGSIEPSRSIGRRASGDVVDGKSFHVTQLPHNPALDK